MLTVIIAHVVPLVMDGPHLVLHVVLTGNIGPQIKEAEIVVDLEWRVMHIQYAPTVIQHQMLLLAHLPSLDLAALGN